MKKIVYLMLVFCISSTAVMAIIDNPKKTVSHDGRQQYKCRRCEGTGIEPLVFPCDGCGGQGEKRTIVDCPGCDGEKIVRDEYGTARRCSLCDGAGKKIEVSICYKCGGSGEMKKNCRACGGSGKRSL